MADREDSTLEIFDSSVFVEAIANTSGNKKEAKKSIRNVKSAANRIPITHELIIGEVRNFLESEKAFENEVSQELAEEEFQKLIDGFNYVDIDIREFHEKLGYIVENKGRIASEFNDSLIVSIALSVKQIDKIHTTDSWNLKKRDIKVNSI